MPRRNSFARAASRGMPSEAWALSRSPRIVICGKRAISLLPYRSDYAELAAFKKYLSKHEGKVVSFLDLVLRGVRGMKEYRAWKKSRRVASR